MCFHVISTFLLYFIILQYFTYDYQYLCVYTVPLRTMLIAYIYCSSKRQNSENYFPSQSVPFEVRLPTPECDSAFSTSHKKVQYSTFDFVYIIDYRLDRRYKRFRTVVPTLPRLGCRRSENPISHLRANSTRFD